MTSTDSTISKPKSHRIGDMNGKYAILFKVALWAIPLMIGIGTPWVIWVTAETFHNRYFREQGSRFTPEDNMKSETKLRNEFLLEIKNLERVISKLPPPEWKQKIHEMEITQRNMEKNQAVIIAAQERMSRLLEELRHPHTSTLAVPLLPPAAAPN